MTKNILLLFISIFIINCDSEKNKSNFTISTWTSAGASFDKDNWEKNLRFS